MIDLNALRAAAAGDPDRKMQVRKAWLTTVLGELEELERHRAARSGSRHRLNETFNQLWEGPIQ